MFGLFRQSRLLIVPILAIDYLWHQMVCKCHAPTGNRLPMGGAEWGSTWMDQSSDQPPRLSSLVPCNAALITSLSSELVDCAMLWFPWLWLTE